MKNTANTVDRFKKAIHDNRFSLSEEIQMIEILVNKYNPMTVSDLAKKQNVSQPAISKRLKKGKLMYIELGSCKLILGE